MATIDKATWRARLALIAGAVGLEVFEGPDSSSQLVYATSVWAQVIGGNKDGVAFELRAESRDWSNTGPAPDREVNITFQPLRVFEDGSNQWIQATLQFSAGNVDLETGRCKAHDVQGWVRNQVERVAELILRSAERERIVHENTAAFDRLKAEFPEASKIAGLKPSTAAAGRLSLRVDCIANEEKARRILQALAEA